MTMISGPVAQGTAGRTTPLLPRLTDYVRKLYLQRRRRNEMRLRRQAFLTLLDLEDRTLVDIGFTRYEVQEAAALPLEINASLALREMARKRREDETRSRRR